MAKTSSKKKKEKAEGFGGLSTTKIMAIFAIIVACFATLYPRFFHPLLFGSGESSKPKQNYDPYDDLPPSARARMGGMDRERGGGPRGPHPGMRYSGGGGESSKRESGGGGRGGMVSTILPVYAVGIVCYLVYTLFKVFGARKKDKNRRRFGRRLTENSSEDEQNGNTEENEEDSNKEDDTDKDKSKSGDSGSDKSDHEKSDSESEEETEEDVKPKKKRDTEMKAPPPPPPPPAKKKSKKASNELEELLLRADEGDMSVEELHALQKRLADTESQLSRILKTMRTLDAKQTAPPTKHRAPVPEENSESEEENENVGEAAAEVTNLAAEPMIEKEESDEEVTKNDVDIAPAEEKVRRRKGGKPKQPEKNDEKKSVKTVPAAGAKEE